MEWTPYRYAFNNPLIFIDPDGRFEYSDGYTKLESRYNVGAVSFYGTYAMGPKEYSDFVDAQIAGNRSSAVARMDGILREQATQQVQQEERIVGEWNEKPTFEITAVEEGKPRGKIRLNPGGKVGIGVAEADYTVTATLSATIIAKRYCGDELVEEISLQYCATITKTVTVGVGVSIPPYSWWNTAKSITTTIVKVPDFVKGAEYYLAFMNALNKIGESNVIPQAVAENHYRY